MYFLKPLTVLYEPVRAFSFCLKLSHRKQIGQEISQGGSHGITVLRIQPVSIRAGEPVTAADG